MKVSARSKAMLPGFIFMICGVIFYMRFGAIILGLLVIPSIVAFFLDRKDGRPAFKVIGACNVSAALPFIVPIVDFSLQKQYAEAGMVMTTQSWMFVYCGAAAGWGMLFLSKYVARYVTLMHYDYAVTMLEKKQAILLKEWGDEIVQATAKVKRA